MKVGLIGFGLAGRVFHAPHIHACEGLELSVIQSSRKEEIHGIYPKVIVVDSIDQALENELDIIVIATPNDTHVEFAKKAILKNCHVIIDKPFTPSFKESKELLGLAKDKSVKISSFHNRRFDGDFLTLKKLIKDEKLGHIKLFNSCFNRMRPKANLENWREVTTIAGGIFYDLGPHLIDQALNLFGPPQELFLSLDSMRENATNDDYFKVQFFYDDKKVELNAHCFNAQPKLRFEVMGDRASYIKYEMDPQESELKENKTVSEIGYDQEINYGKLYDISSNYEIVKTERGQYIEYYNNFRDAIVGIAKLEVTDEDILNVQKAIDLLIESHSFKKIIKWS